MLAHVDDLPTIQDPAAAKDVPPHSDALAARCREAIRARFVADRIGASPAASTRLEERVRRFEEAAASVEMPSQWYFLESARLIRVGDLAEATSAFDAGLAASVADAAIVPHADIVGTPPPDTGAASVQRTVPWDRIALGTYLVLLAIAELAVTFGNPLLVFPLHGGIVALAALHVAWLDGRSVKGAPDDRLKPFLLTFIVVASIRIISLTLPLAAIEPAYRYLMAGIPMTLGAVLVARAAHYSVRDVGLVWRRWRMQVAVVVLSIGLGFIEFAILQPAPMGPLPWVAGGVIPALVVGIATSLPEELIFRGVLQTATRPILGRLNWIYASLVFAVLHIGYINPVDLLFVFGVGLLYGWVFERSRSIAGVSIGHGLANVVLFFVAPNLPAIVSLFGP